MSAMQLETWQAVMLLLVVLLVAYALMWRGWRRRAGKHDLPPLMTAPSVAGLLPAELTGEARYFGTTVAGDWLDRVVAQGLGARSRCRLSLSTEGLDVIRADGSFRIPVAALRGARQDQGIAGKVVPPHGLLVVTWQHGDFVLDTGFRLSDSGSGSARGGVTEAHGDWVGSITAMATGRPESAEGGHA